MLAQYLLSSRVCLSVTSQSCTKMAKRIGSLKQRHTIAERIEFFSAKDLCEILMGSPHQGRQMQVG